MLITVKVKKRDDNGELTNEIKGFESKSVASKPQQAPQNSSTPPWRR